LLGKTGSPAFAGDDTECHSDTERDNAVEVEE
jgi:hypothetical protein